LINNKHTIMAIAKKDYIFEEKFKVRDYECDLQGIVNNANYQHYTEHACHEFFLSRGVSFADLHDKGIDLVVSKITIEYKKSLKSGDDFVCRLYMEKEGIRYVYYQDIYRLADNALCAKTKTETVCVVDGKLAASCQELDELLK